MHAITLTYSLSYAAAVTLGVGKSGTGQLDAAPVLAQIGTAERAWLAEHPKAVFNLDSVVDGADDLVGERLATAVAREIRAACLADSPLRLRHEVAAKFLEALEAARGGDHVYVHVSLPRRVSDGASHLSGGLSDLTDADVGPGLLRALERYLQRCVLALRRPHLADTQKAPALLRAAYLDGVAEYEERVVRSALEAAKEGPLPCWHSDSAWVRRRVTEGVVGIEVVEDKAAPNGRTFRWSDHPGVVRARGLAGAIEASLRQLELLEAVARERKGAREACDTLLAAITEASICSALDPEQVSRRALGALPDGELQQALIDDLIERIGRAIADLGDYEIGPLEGEARWGELPRGGSDVARALDQLACVDEWGDASDSHGCPVIAVCAVALDGTEHLLEIVPITPME